MPRSVKAAGVKVTIANYADMVHCFIYLRTAAAPGAMQRCRRRGQDGCRGTLDEA